MHPKMHLCSYYSQVSFSTLHHQLAKVVCTWLQQYDPKGHGNKHHCSHCKFSMALVDTIDSLVQEITGQEDNAMLIMASFMYAERFIIEVGITHDSIVNICIVRCV